MLQPEHLYVQKGAENELNNSTITTSLDYIQITVLGKYGFSTGGGSFAPYVAAGPYLGFNVNAEAEDENGNTADRSDSITGTDFGLSGEVGADVSGFNIGLRYDLGLSNIDDTGSGLDQSNRALLITAGYSF